MADQAAVRQGSQGQVPGIEMDRETSRAIVGPEQFAVDVALPVTAVKVAVELPPMGVEASLQRQLQGVGKNGQHGPALAQGQLAMNPGRAGAAGQADGACDLAREGVGGGQEPGQAGQIEPFELQSALELPVLPEPGHVDPGRQVAQGIGMGGQGGAQGILPGLEGGPDLLVEQGGALLDAGPAQPGSGGGERGTQLQGLQGGQVELAVQPGGRGGDPILGQQGVQPGQAPVVQAGLDRLQMTRPPRQGLPEAQAGGLFTTQAEGSQLPGILSGSPAQGQRFGQGQLQRRPVALPLEVKLPAGEQPAAGVSLAPVAIAGQVEGGELGFFGVQVQPMLVPPAPQLQMQAARAGRRQAQVAGLVHGLAEVKIKLQAARRGVGPGERTAHEPAPGVEAVQPALQLQRAVEPSLEGGMELGQFGSLQGQGQVVVSRCQLALEPKRLVTQLEPGGSEVDRVRSGLQLQGSTERVARPAPLPGGQVQLQFGVAGGDEGQLPVGQQLELRRCQPGLEVCQVQLAPAGESPLRQGGPVAASLELLAPMVSLQRLQSEGSLAIASPCGQGQGLVFGILPEVELGREPGSQLSQQLSPRLERELFQLTGGGRQRGLQLQAGLGRQPRAQGLNDEVGADFCGAAALKLPIQAGQVAAEAIVQLHCLVGNLKLKAQGIVAMQSDLAPGLDLAVQGVEVQAAEVDALSLPVQAQAQRLQVQGLLVLAERKLFNAEFVNGQGQRQVEPRQPWRPAGRAVRRGVVIQGQPRDVQPRNADFPAAEVRRAQLQAECVNGEIKGVIPPTQTVDPKPPEEVAVDPLQGELREGSLQQSGRGPGAGIGGQQPGEGRQGQRCHQSQQEDSPPCDPERRPGLLHSGGPRKMWRRQPDSRSSSMGMARSTRT